jgi:nucleotide-binding universal stress UspA family protein
MLYFAYDGTLNGDWVSHYAIHLAARLEDRTLRAIHIADPHGPPPDLHERLHLLRDRCGMAGVALEAEVYPHRDGPLAGLLAAVPPGEERYLVCGTRARARRGGFLAGTVPERLMKLRRQPVLAVRVVQPGLLGAPHRLLVPLAGTPQGLDAALPWLRLLATDLRDLQFLRVRKLSRWRYRHLTYERGQALRREGADYLGRVEAQARQALPLAGAHVDATVTVSDDVPKEIVIHAARAKSQLICLGVSARNLTERFVYGNPIEQVLTRAPCDVAVYQGPA